MPTVFRQPAEIAPVRMSALARLPVFLDLGGRRAVVAGGTAALASKAELLAAAGANVEIYASLLDREMAALVGRAAACGTIIRHDRAWSGDFLNGAAIAIADVDSDDEAKAFHRAAVAAGVRVHIIGRPAFCQFEFGEIVNRSPVVVSISAGGSAPILGQTIRRRIETLLPASLASWGKLAMEIRPAVNARLEPGPPRRGFWERFSDRAIGSAPAPGEDIDCAELIDDIAGARESGDGKVTLVGAGPGDCELLTLKAVRALQSADVILFDDLVSDEVLDLARREARRMMVGKRGGRESCRQDDINDLMIKLARQGKHVVRLKSGDPMIFGRAGEEIARLEEQGIAVHVVPGISSGIAMAAQLGVSLTHRDYAHSVRFITGHARNGKLPDGLDWKGIADPETTLIVYMGGRTAAQLAGRLIEEGLSAATPVVVATSVSRAAGTHRRTTLGGLATGISDADGAGLEPGAVAGPVLLGIGRVFSDRQRESAEDLEPAAVDGEGRPACERMTFATKLRVGE